MSRALVRALLSEGILIWRDDFHIRLVAPAGMDVAGRVAEVRANKESVLASLSDVGLRSRPQLLSPNQVLLWIASRIDPGSPSYNIDIRVELRRDLNSQILTAAMEKLCDRQSTLCCSIIDVDGFPIAVRKRAPVLDNETVSAATIESNMDRYADRNLDLSHEGTLRARLIEDGAGRNYFQCVVHHMVIDFASIGILVGELEEIYLSMAEDRAPLLEGVTSFTKFVDYLAARKETERGIADREYWKQAVSGLPLSTRLPTDRHLPPERSGWGTTIQFEIDSSTTEMIRRVAAESGCTAYVVCLAAYVVLIHRYGGDRTCVIGTPFASRPDECFGRTIGYFSNTLPVAISIDPGQTAKGLIGSVRGQVLQAFEHQYFPLASILENRPDGGGVGRSPLFQTAFAWEQFGPGKAKRPQGGEDRALVRDMSCRQRGAAYELSLMLFDSGLQVHGHLQFQTSLFSKQVAEGITRHYKAVLREICQSPNRPIDHVSMLDAKEAAAILTHSGVGEGDGYGPRTVIERIKQQVERQQERVAVEYEGAVLTYGELWERCLCVSGSLQGWGAAEGKAVVISCGPGIDRIVTALGILLCGSTIVLVAEDIPDMRLRQVLEQVNASLLVHDRQEAVPVEEFTSSVHISTLLADTTARHLSEVAPRSIAYIVFTSGTTGLPKGICTSHAALDHLAHWTEGQLEGVQDVRSAQLAASGFDAFIWECFCFLACGATVHVASNAKRTDLGALRSWMIERALTHSFLPTPIAEAVGREKKLPITLNKIFVGGDRLRAVGNLLAVATVVNIYGPSENAVISTAHTISESDIDEDIPIGRPISGCQAYVLDPAGQPAPIGFVGELWLGGRGLAEGYLGSTNKTNQSFVEKALGAEGSQRLYRTGDMVRMDQMGQLYFVGRNDDQIKINGQRIELSEIEQALCRQECVDEAVVVFDNAAKCLIAFVTGMSTSGEVLLKRMRTELPRYMVPVSINHIQRIPLTSNGKIDRKALLEQFRKRAPSNQREATNEVERWLLAMWSRLLGSQELRIDDNLTAIGTFSLMILHAATEIREQFGLNLGVKELFQLDTISAQAELIGVLTESLQAHDMASEAIAYEEGAL